VKRNIVITTILTAVMLLSSFIADAKEVNYTYSSDTAADEWLVNGKSENVSFDDTGIIYSAYSGTFSAIYEGVFEDTEYSLTLENQSGKSGNAMHVYFNYRDEENTYYFKIGGAKEDNPVVLYKIENGVREELATYPHYSINYSPKEFKVVCKNGNINISVTDKGETTELFNINDDTFTSGQIGIGGVNAKGKFTGISVRGNVTSYMKIISVTPEDKSTDVTTDINPVIEFDKELRSETVTKESVYVTADSQKLSEDLYSVTAEGRVVTVFLNDMKESTEYTIVVTTGVKSVDDESIVNEYSFSFETYKGENYKGYVYSYENESQWICTSPEKITASETGFASNAWDAKFITVLNSYIFSDELVYSVKFSNSGGAASNSVQIFFNYTDADNNCYVNIGGSKDGAYPMTLYKNESGTKTVLGTATISNNILVKIKYKNGRIEVLSGDESKIIAEDNAFSGGRIGLGVQNTVGTFKNIEAEGYLQDVQLKITEDSNVFYNDTDVSLNPAVELVFNFEIKSGAVKKENIQITEAGVKMAESEYEIALDETKTKLTVTFNRSLNEKTYYSIVFSDAVVSSEYNVCLTKQDRELIFLTKPPVYDVQYATIKYFDNELGEYTDINDISKMGGKDVRFNISVKNNSDKSQTFAISAMLVQPDGKLLASRFYYEELDSGEEFEKTDSDSDTVISVPSDIADGSRLVYFVWDSFINMNTLYPGGEF